MESFYIYNRFTFMFILDPLILLISRAAVVVVVITMRNFIQQSLNLILARRASLTKVPPGNKAKRLSPVNHSAKTIHQYHHHHHHHHHHHYHHKSFSKTNKGIMLRNETSLFDGENK